MSAFSIAATLHGPASIRRRLWVVYPLAVLPFAILYVATDGPLHSGFAFNAIGASGVVAILVGVWLNRPSPRLPWLLFAFGQALFITGDVIAYNYQRFFGRPLPFPAISDVPYLSVAPILAAGILMLIAQRTAGRDRSAALDALVVAVGLGIVSWVMLISPYEHDGTLSLFPKTVLMAYPLGDLLILLLAARMVLGGGGRRSASLTLMAASAGALVVTDSIYGWTVNHGSYHPGDLLDLGWVMFYVGWGAAALHPSMTAVSETTSTPTRLTFKRLALLALAALAPPAVELVQNVRGQPLDSGVAALGAAVLFLLVILRMAGLVRNEQRLSTTVHALAEARAVHAEETSQSVTKELRHSQELYRIVVENTSDMIGLIDVDGTIAYVSPSQFGTLGYSPDALVGSKLEELVHPDDSAKVDAATSAALGGAPTELVTRVRRADGEYATLGAAISRIVDEHGEVQGLVASARDVSESVRVHELEVRLQQSERLEAVGRLAGGIAHDFNNLLTAITGYGDLALAALDGHPDDDLRDSIQEIRRASDRAAALTRQLLAFSRKQVLQPRVLDLNDVVAGYEPMLKRLLGDHIDVRFNLAEDAGAVCADEGQLGQVVINLAVNARDAMPDGGTMTVATRRIELDGVTAPVGLPPASYAVLSVSDTGVGMEKTVVDQIFEPFFTTKPDGEGTGLGLATVIGIVQQSDGQVTVYSEPGLGATFNVYLPRTEAPLAVSLPAVRSAVVRGTEQVLLVEDNDQVRTLLLQALGSLGYSLLEASTPRAALALSKAFEGHIDLLVTDVVMPEMNGRQLAEELLGQRPDLRVLYTSGYTDDAMVGRGVLTSGMAFLQKPFAIEQLARKAREVLDAA